MGKETKIGWTDTTYNHWIGCTKVSAGCAHCYAENSFPARVNRGNGRELWGKGAERILTGENNKRELFKLHDQLEPDAGRHFVFSASLSDWLDDEVPIAYLEGLLRLIHQLPKFTWQLLTKRPENFHKRMRDVLKSSSSLDDFTLWLEDWIWHGKPHENIWIGVSAEDQENYAKRIPYLSGIPAKVRFLSCEPLLGPIDIEANMWLTGSKPPVDWVIVGGESGAKCREMRPEWVEFIARQCGFHEIPFFFKQWGGNPDKRDGGKAILFGQTWTEFPA